MLGRGSGSRWWRVAVTATLVFIAGCLAGTPRPECEPASGEEEAIGTICGFRNPEDLEYVAGRNVILAVAMYFDGLIDDGGFISAVVPGGNRVWTAWPAADTAAAAAQPELGDPECTDAPDVDAFYPHGLTSTSAAERTLVYVAAHAGKRGGREAVEIFELTGDGEDTRLVWKACIPTPDAVQVNDIAVTAGGTIAASNYQPDGSTMHVVTASLLRRPTGNVMVWTREEGWRVLDGTDSLLANGVALSPAGDTVFYTESLTGKLHRRPLVGDGGAIAIDIGGTPDNIMWTPRGTMLVATHLTGFGLMLCNSGKAPCTTGWEVHEVDPHTLASRRLIEHDGTIVGAIATAVEVDGRVYLGSVYDDRIGVVTLDDDTDSPSPGLR